RMHNGTKFLLVFLTLTFFPISPGHSAPKRKGVRTRVTYGELLKLAITHAPSLRMARLKLAGYDAMLSGSKLLYAPTFTISFQGAPSPKFTCVVPRAWIDSADLGGMSEKEFREQYCVGTNRDDSVTLDLDGYALRFQVKAVQPLFTFGKISYSKAMVRAAVRGGEANLAAKSRDLQLLLRKAWYGRKAVHLIAALLKDAETMMSKAKVKASAWEKESKITPVQLIRLKLGENQILRKKLDVGKMDAISLATLRLFAGKDVDIEPGNFSVNKTPPKPLKSLMEQALKRRPEVRALEALRAAKTAKVGLARAAFYPNLGIFVQYTLKLSNSDDPKSVYANDGLHGNSLAFGVGLEMKFDPARMITDLRLARLERREADAQIAAAKDMLRLKLAKARQEVVYQIKRIKLLSRAVKLSRSWTLAISDQEEQGTFNPKEMVDALTSYFTMKLALIEARYELAYAWAALRHATGETI
ncbi:TolC family protein, partial [Myxococcota bacterium]|nr:TolC family protein [Myxococcota bacterium]MBU1535976.1 TolC family protein [Myxococcota bacterium]